MLPRGLVLLCVFVLHVEQLLCFIQRVAQLRPRLVLGIHRLRTPTLMILADMLRNLFGPILPRLPRLLQLCLLLRVPFHLQMDARNLLCSSVLLFLFLHGLLFLSRLPRRFLRRLLCCRLLRWPLLCGTTTTTTTTTRLLRPRQHSHRIPQTRPHQHQLITHNLQHSLPHSASRPPVLPLRLLPPALHSDVATQGPLHHPQTVGGY